MPSRGMASCRREYDGDSLLCCVQAGKRLTPAQRCVVRGGGY